MSPESTCSYVSFQAEQSTPPPYPTPNWSHEETVLVEGLWRGDPTPNLSPQSSSQGISLSNCQSPGQPPTAFSPDDSNINPAYGQNNFLPCAYTGLYPNSLAEYSGQTFSEFEQAVASISSDPVNPSPPLQSEHQPSESDKEDPPLVTDHQSQNRKRKDKPLKTAPGQSVKHGSTQRKAKAQSRKQSNSLSVDDDNKHQTGENVISVWPVRTDQRNKGLRERNRIVASKHRMKKNQDIQNLQSHVDSLSRRNGELTAQATKLKQEVQWLKNQLLKHGRCSSPIIQGWILSQARRFVEGTMHNDSEDAGSSRRFTTPDLQHQ